MAVNRKRGRQRDFQRGKVYKAERDLSAPCGEFGGRLETIPEIHQWVTEINRSRWMRGYVRRRLRQPGIEIQHSLIKVGDGRGRRSACAQLTGWHGNATLKFPKWSRSRLVILHEMCHVYTNWHYPAWHGREFCANYLEFIKRWLGKEAHAEIKASFQRNGVKFRRVK